MFQPTTELQQAGGLCRREFLADATAGLFGIALAWLGQSGQATAAGEAGVPAPHFKPRVKRVINIFSPGGVSHVDTFDYKPKLAQLDGQELTGKGKLDTFFGTPGKLMKSPYGFRQYGQCGRWVSDLLPCLANCVDQMTFIHSMVAKSSSHTPACFQMNTGFVQTAFPAWAPGYLMAWARPTKSCPRSWCCPMHAAWSTAARTIGARASCRLSIRERYSAAARRPWPTCKSPPRCRPRRDLPVAHC